MNRKPSRTRASMSVSTVHLCRLHISAGTLIQICVCSMHSFKLVCCTCPCTRSDSLVVFPLTNVLIQDWLVVLPARWTTCCRTRTTVWCSARTAMAPTSRAAACTSRPCTKRQVRNNLLAQTSPSQAQPHSQCRPMSSLFCIFVGLLFDVVLRNRCQRLVIVRGH